MDDNNHGTHVSGTIGAVGNNNVGVAGVNWTASIMGLKFLNRQGSGSTADAVDAIEFAIQAKQAFGAAANVRVLSNSWGGGGYSQALYDEINKAYSADMLFSAAAGNNGSNNDSAPSYPASYNLDNVVAVAATDSSDALASWSNYGSTSVDLAAPGVNVYSTLRGGGYGYMSGTSMATPHVSGVAALVLSACGGLATGDLKRVLLGYVDAVPGLAGKVATGGRLNADSAVAKCGTVPPPPPPDFSIAASPASRSIRRGQSTTSTVSVIPANGFLGNVGLVASVSPSGPSQGFGTNPIQISSASAKSSVLTIGTTSTTTRTTYTIKITGTGTVGTPPVSHSASVTLTVR
jgi:subtilisin family serine protease